MLSTEVAGADGTSLANTIRIEFKTTDALVVGQVFPADAANSVDTKSAITVIFNKPVVALTSLEDQANLDSPIEISPAIAGGGQWVSSSVYVYQPTTGLASGTNYLVRVNSGLKDTTGSTLEQDYVWGFITGSCTSCWTRRVKRSPERINRLRWMCQRSIPSIRWAK